MQWGNPELDGTGIIRYRGRNRGATLRNVQELIAAVGSARSRLERAVAAQHYGGAANVCTAAGLHDPCDVAAAYSNGVQTAALVFLSVDERLSKQCTAHADRSTVDPWRRWQLSTLSKVGIVQVDLLPVVK